MSNVHGIFGCARELDTAHLHVLAVSNHAVVLAICKLHLLPRPVPAGLVVSDLQPSELGGVEVADEQCAWYVRVCA